LRVNEFKLFSFLNQYHFYLMEEEFAMEKSVDEKAIPLNDQLAELSQRVQAIESAVEAYTKQLAEMKSQVAQMTALLEGKAKDVDEKVFASVRAF